MRPVSGRRLAALMAKEIVQIRRDPSTLLIAFVLPLVLLFLFGCFVRLPGFGEQFAHRFQVVQPTLDGNIRRHGLAQLT